MPSRRSDRLRKRSRRHALRAAFLFCGCLCAASALAEGARSLDEISALDGRQRENALAAIRNTPDGDPDLLALETEASLRADARRESGEPPRFPGCLRADEFELGVQLALARAAYDSKAYRLLAVEFRRLSTSFTTALASAQTSGKWRKRFAHLGHWIEDWERASEPDVRELLRRTLVDQAIRASLSSFQGAAVYGQARPTAALRAYDEFIFNRMCMADEDNLNWLKEKISSSGWFDIGRYGAAADNAAWLLVQHADGDPGYQASVAVLLEPKVASGDTNPANFAYLSDRIAVRNGRPQRFATQAECVQGQWLAPRIEDPDGLDARRAAMGLEPYRDQLARRKHLCHEQTARKPAQ
jgi:Family of unknown function (DUF6624)